ncbi:Tc5 transposase DNA-binding domain-containing protein [Aspergillus flavus]|uniref:Tc5 transposase DNA-binding domain-containing protein n=3 Tax=Aspergillus subgen. Circumdati TaxID=2720871 RepID=A0A7U2MS93_ASPFN|nr:hypothetical protein Ao3042_01043 [Aspergillus oryzae 3.042]KDE77349.1 hypothetical protein AO1008_03486 [Aspergillus oryzae 100-8]KOC11188.1 hypothetical protein AFLA70_187g002061 [Aspergillus flavus AF70]QRD88982.1 Tc5 transposase DNA-binding domain-containing protein [Aspergillus flavus]RMZ38489.1 hypothetical protein CA14_007884 [Aspergillus flavus]|eukprot:EIT72711.1 hypothetical protein Ao3042_01043 [Aspergillus oryzae 3.042]
MIFLASAAMDTESTHAQDNDYTQSPWLDLGGFSPSQQSPPLDYHGFGYGMLPLESAYGVSVPPPYASLPLTMPSNTWPSMMSTHPQHPFPEGSVPAVPIPPAVSPVTHNPPPPPPPPPPPRKSSTSNSTPRRTLTDDDRRRMCLYHEENKTAKQTDIGAIFGVERSTVSKVLRQKEKYLNPDDGTRSPIKRAKGRVPDIEKALSNWVRNYQRHGYPLSDEMIREKAIFFANTCGSPDGKEKVLSTSWMEKFKHKNNLMGLKSRKSSFSAKSDSESPRRLSINSAIASAIQSPSVLSPISPTGFATPSPLSPTQSQENFRPDNLRDLLGDYQNARTTSTISIDTTSSVSAGVTSPTSTLVTDSPFTPASQSHNPSTDSNQNRPRSQTFPFIGVDPSVLSPDEQPDQLSPKTGLQQATLQESPFMDEYNPKAIPSLDTSSSTIKRNRSNPEIKAKSIYPPLFPKSTTVSPISSPGSPTQDEARRALELVMNYFEHQPTGLGAQDYLTIGGLMERLELAKSQQTTLPGGLTRIDEHDDGPHLHKKRSIRSLG